MKLIVGLGNPGRRYANNRHNIGYMCVNHFGKAHDIQFDRKQGQARIGTGEVAGNEVVLARPQTYMNESGLAVSQLVRRFRVELADLVVIHDDLDLPLGKIRIRCGGRSAGHKGIESIIAELGSPDFIRVRIGIGRPAESPAEVTESDVIDWVLSDFTSQERQIIEATIPRVSEALLCLLTDGLSAAMNQYNRNSSGGENKLD
jgi:PTH1 family peptidyl-tRNA hydrolase